MKYDLQLFTGSELVGYAFADSGTENCTVKLALMPNPSHTHPKVHTQLKHFKTIATKKAHYDHLLNIMKNWCLFWHLFVRTSIHFGCILNARITPHGPVFAPHMHKWAVAAHDFVDGLRLFVSWTTLKKYSVQQVWNTPQELQFDPVPYPSQFHLCQTC